MKHGRKTSVLGRKHAARKALLASLSKALLREKRIITTLAKAKALRPFLEPLLTRAKEDTTHAHRHLFAHFQDKEPVKILFGEVRDKIQARNGGYLRIIKLAPRKGDGAEMAMVELVDYNADYVRARVSAPAQEATDTSVTPAEERT